MVPLLFLVSLILFVIISMLPGDVVTSMVTDGNMESIERMRDEMGLSRPWYVQYADWAANVLSGNFGRSLLNREPVADKILSRFPVTLELTLLSIIISIVIAIPLGIMSAVRRNSISDIICNFIAMAGIAMPPFWIGILLMLLFSVKLGWLPASGFVYFSDDPVGNLKCMAMPALSIGFAFAATVMRQTRSAILEVLNQDYIVTAYSKGLSERIVLWKHALRNALIPVLTVISMQIGRLIGGAVVTETVFTLPGIGREIAASLLDRDFPVCISMILLTAVFVVLINTLTDIFIVIVDPRIAHSNKTA
jgi:peptide/nickel transport system permease protein